MTSHQGPLRIAVIGCGNVSRQYLKTLSGDPRVDVVCCADLEDAPALSLSAEFGIPVVSTPTEALANPNVDLILNLTRPDGHAAVTLQALNAGKHVYSEKPLALTTSEAMEILELARSRGLHVGCAPDTFLGHGLQATKALIESGEIGRPILAQISRLTPGPEVFHPNPGFLYRDGAGPLLDVGPYLVTTLTYLLGSIEAVTALTSNMVPLRKLQTGDHAGESIVSSVATSLISTMEFSSGAIGVLTQSWDLVGAQPPSLEIHGTEGSLHGTPPDSWSGSPLLRHRGDDGFIEQLQPIGQGGVGGIGVGVLEMSDAIRGGRVPAASAFRAAHTLEVLLGILESGKTRSRVPIRSKISTEHM